MGDCVKKRIKQTFFILCIIMSATMIYTIFTNAKSNKTTYVALGDSIAAGYGLDGYSSEEEVPPPDSYQAIVAKFLKTKPFNYAVSGDDSTDCIDILSSGIADDTLSKADIITISIGSNDLLKPFIEIVKQTPVNSLIIQLKNNKTLHEKAQAFSEKFNEILSLLKQKAPQAEIYVTNIYNPFNNVMILGESADTYIKEINKAFNMNSDNYTLIDLYTLFKKKNFTNVQFDISNLSNINLDPHPSKEGHREIATAIIDALNNKYAPDTPVITYAKSTSKNKITVNLSCATKNCGYEIKFSKSKNGKFNSLADVSKNKANIKSLNLKSKKTYYIKARCYNNINGTTYYSTYSKVKKVVIK